MTQEPWAGHAKPLAELDDAAVAAFVARDEELWALARTEPFRAVRRAIGDRVFFRTGVPRIGEPVYRSERQAKLDQRSMYCGRGTGHFGTGLYFFGTLAAATASPRSPASLLGRDGGLASMVAERRDAVYVVDMEHVPLERILMPGAKLTYKLHEFAKALLCWPRDRARFLVAQEAEADLKEALRTAEEAYEASSDAEDAWYRQEEARQELQEAHGRRLDLHGDLRALQRTLEWDGLKLDSVPFEGFDRNAVGFDLNALPRTPPRASGAIGRYLRDIEERRYPGLHPMTYYMTALGYQAVVQQDWSEFNSGDIGNIWYPVVRQAGPE